MTPGNPSIPSQQRTQRGPAAPIPTEALDRGRAVAIANTIRMCALAACRVDLAELERFVARASQGAPTPRDELELAAELGVSRQHLSGITTAATALLAFRRVLDAERLERPVEGEAGR